jgi:hypothetical protein
MSDNDDWQSHALSTRHMHNRSSRPTSTKQTFSIRKTFATYEVKCPAWRNLESDQTASLDLYRLSENGEGVVGEMVLPGVLSAAVVLAASRASLGELVEGLKCREEGEEGDESSEEDEEDGKSDDEEEEDHDDEEARNCFTKNSFRAPKFWLQWRGTPTVPKPPSTAEKEISGSSEELPGALTPPKPDIEDETTGLGYIVFSTNECRKFKGTLNCSALGWKDVSLTGHRMAGRNTSDVRVTWGEGGRVM